MGFRQANKLLRIRTILDDDPAEKGFDGDPLLLVKLDGTEGISRLFGYDIVMLREAGGIEGGERPQLDLTRLIGTPVEFGARPYTRSHLGPIPLPFTDEEPFLYRFGMFETVEEAIDIDITHFGPFHVRDFRIYRAHIAPWAKALDRDICYRVFENQTVLDIIEAVVGEARQSLPHLHVDTAGLHDGQHPFSAIEYCVQFGESTLDFLSRLMARFGIWYFFGHRAGDQRFLNETMILRGHWSNAAPPVRENEVTIDDDITVFKSKSIAKLVRRFRPPQRKVGIGGFNYLDPTHPFVKDAATDPANDLWRGDKKAENGPPLDTPWTGTTNFAAPVGTQADADALAKVASHQNQAEIVGISGISRHPAFLAGHAFHIKQADDDDPKDLVNQDFIIDSYSISCHDYNYINLAFWQVADTFFPTFSTLDTDSVSFADAAAAKVSMWVSNNAQNQVFPIGKPDQGNPNSPGQLWAPTSNQGPNGTTKSVPLYQSALATAFWLSFQNIDLKKVFQDQANLMAYANSFVAISAKAPVYFPLPLARRPIAHGPHTAVVVGEDGTDTRKHDVYSDAIGRVRIRFPWDPGPPEGSSKLPPHFPFSQPDKPTRVGKNTCWVRVVEGWAGRHYGIHFLPRIGQEVLVDFLDGDPEFPVICGRLYNADKGFTNRPFVTEETEKTKLDKISDLPKTAHYDTPYSGIKTDSIPTTDSSGNPLKKRFHLLRFKDTRDKEQYLIRSQWRMDVTAFGSYYDTNYGSRHLSIGGKKTSPTKEVGGDYVTKVFRHCHLHVGDPEFPSESGNRYTLIEQNDELHVKKDARQIIDGNWSTSCGTMSVTAGGPTTPGTIVLSATANISLVVGASTIVLTPAGIALQAPMITMQMGSAPATPTPPSVDPPQDPEIADPGDTSPDPK